MNIEDGHRGYIAGVIDCDGSIFVASHNGSYRLGLSVFNSSRQLPEWFASTFGRKIYSIRRRSDKHSTEYSWTIYNKGAADIIQKVLPFMVVKRKQALLAIEFAATLDIGSRLPESFKGIRQRVCEEMKELNKRGIR